MNPEHMDPTALVAQRMQVGATARRTRTVSARDIELFTEMTGDRNPLHYDEDLARRSRFGGIVVQGGVTPGLLNALVAEDLPGPGSVFLQADWRFLAPVHPGDVITAEARVPLLREDKPVTTLQTRITNQDGVRRHCRGGGTRSRPARGSQTRHPPHRRPADHRHRQREAKINHPPLPLCGRPAPVSKSCPECRRRLIRTAAKSEDWAAMRCGGSIETSRCSQALQASVRPPTPDLPAWHHARRGRFLECPAR